MISYSWRYSLDFWNIFTTWLPNLTVNLGVGLWPATYQCYCFIQWLAGLLAQLRMELCWGLITPGDSVVPCRKEEDTKASDLLWKKVCSGLHGPRVEGGWGRETSLFLHWAGVTWPCTFAEYHPAHPRLTAWPHCGAEAAAFLTRPSSSAVGVRGVCFVLSGTGFTPWLQGHHLHGAKPFQTTEKTAQKWTLWADILILVEFLKIIKMV